MNVRVTFWRAAGGPLIGVDGETNEMEQDSVDKVERDTPDEGVSEEVVAHDLLNSPALVSSTDWLQRSLERFGCEVDETY